MKTEGFFSTTNLKLASSLQAMGASLRNPDPVTALVTPNSEGDVQYTFWFHPVIKDGTVKKEGGANFTCQELANHWDAAWGTFTLDDNHVMYWMRAAFENRESLIKLARKSTPFLRHKKGRMEIMIPVRPTPATKEVFKKMGIL